MKLLAEVRAVERTRGNNPSGGSGEKVEKRVFKLDVRPATKASAYYGYGSMNFVLHGRELEEFGADLGDNLELYLVKPDADKPSQAEVDGLRREIYELEQRLVSADERRAAAEKREASERAAAFDRQNRMAALQTENVRLTVENQTYKMAMGHKFDQPLTLEGTQP